MCSQAPSTSTAPAQSNHTGSFHHANNTHLRFLSGIHIFSSTSVIEAGNGIIFDGAIISIYGSFLPSNFQLLSGTTTFYISIDIVEVLIINGGTLELQVDSSLAGLYFNGTNTVLELGANITLSITGALSSHLLLMISDSFTWAGTNNMIRGNPSSYIVLELTCTTSIIGSGNSQYVSHLLDSIYSFASWSL